MSTDPRLKPLGELRQLDLITSDEYDDTLAELQIIEIQRAHNASSDSECMCLRISKPAISRTGKGGWPSPRL